MSMTIEVPENASGFELPSEYHTKLPIRFLYANRHFRWAKLVLKPFEKHFIKSEIISIACCQEAGQNPFDSTIDDIHTHCFGQGKWLKKLRTELPPLASQQSACEDRESEAFRHLGIGSKRSWDEAGLDFGEQLRRLSESLDDLPSRMVALRPQEANSGTKKRQGPARYNNNKKTLVAEAGDIEQNLRLLLEETSATDHQKDTVRATIDLKIGVIAISDFVEIVLNGVDFLIHAEKAKGTTPSFTTLLEFRRTRQSEEHMTSRNILDDGDHLAKLLEPANCGSSKSSGKQTTGYTIVSGNARVFRQFLLELVATGEGGSADAKRLSPKLVKLLTESQGNNCQKPPGKVLRKLRLFNAVMDELCGRVDGSALGLHAAVEAIGSQLSCLDEVKEKDWPRFVSKAAGILESRLSSIPDSTTVLHFPALLSWLLDIEYRDVCQGLGLSQFGGHDPGIASKLDTLAAESSSPETNKTMLEVKFQEVCRVTMGRLRSTAGNASRIESSVQNNSGASGLTCGTPFLEPHTRPGSDSIAPESFRTGANAPLPSPPTEAEPNGGLSGGVASGPMLMRTGWSNFDASAQPSHSPSLLSYPPRSIVRNDASGFGHERNSQSSDASAMGSQHLGGSQDEPSGAGMPMASAGTMHMENAGVTEAMAGQGLPPDVWNMGADGCNQGLLSIGTNPHAGASQGNEWSGTTINDIMGDFSDSLQGDFLFQM